jgi:hypothetical protein
MEKLIFVCSPYRGDMKINAIKAREYCRYVIGEGYTPIAPHLLYPQFLDDSKPDERDQGIQAGLEILKRCDEIWIFGQRITPGMMTEIEAAGKLKLPVFTVTVKEAKP